MQKFLLTRWCFSRDGSFREDVLSPFIVEGWAPPLTVLRTETAPFGMMIRIGPTPSIATPQLTRLPTKKYSALEPSS